MHGMITDGSRGGTFFAFSKSGSPGYFSVCANITPASSSSSYVHLPSVLVSKVPSSYKETVIGLEPITTTSFQRYHICKDPFQRNHSHQYQGLGFQHIFLGGTI